MKYREMIFIDSNFIIRDIIIISADLRLYPSPNTISEAHNTVIKNSTMFLVIQKKSILLIKYNYNISLISAA
ncbi:hypothetical protein AXW59_09165 [Yersinia ruckeri]|nr:hypothetical protein AXW59_09165 [Yersinia ruckeri]OJC01861.1 hypothetical protein AXW58_09130 [Yersinia ruckeri]OJC04410.1 hypothetical protein AXW57_09155 [Yersinia ruckeri]